MKLYTSEGWLNVPALANVHAWLRVIVGKRQIGKTYGVLKYMLDRNRRFILLRRTVEEVQFLGTNPAVSPFTVYEPERHIKLQRTGKVLDIIDEDAGDCSMGICMGLPTVATVRGFSAGGFTDIVFDEFIPEKHVITRKTEGDALLNAYTTINGNRELQGRPPVNLWLLANTNNINSPILKALGLVDPLLQMRERGKEWQFSNGVLLVQPTSEKITQARKDTVMVKHLKRSGSAERFLGMSIENDWSYNEAVLVGKMSMSGLKPLASYSFMYIWERADGFLYVCRTSHTKEMYGVGEYDTEKFRDQYYWLFDVYRSGQIRFSDLHLLELFRAVFDIKF